jgi:hypothetical protein
MGCEPGGGGFSKTQFFLMCACNINHFLYSTGTLDKNIGNLYALGYNGLICMGASTIDGGGSDKSSFTRALRNGDCFGKAYLDYINSSFSTSTLYALLGAGTLCAQPYIQYGSDVIENEYITGIRLVWSRNPVFIRGVTVTGNDGNLYATSSYDAASSPFGTHGEIVIRAETVLSPSGVNEVLINAF